MMIDSKPLSRRDLAVIFALSLVVRGATAIAFDNPGYFDAYAYMRVADNMVHGRGMVEDFVWSYVDTRAIARALPHPSHLYWMPMTTWLAWLGERALAWALPAFRAAQAPFVVLGAILPPAAAALAWALHRSRAWALQAALIALFVPAYFVRWTMPEPCAPFALAVIGMATLLVVEARALRGRMLVALAAGALAGLGHLARADGVLLVPLGIALIARDRAANRAARAVSFALGYAIALAPWIARQVIVSGSALPGGGLKTAFFRDYDDMFAFDTPIGPGRLLEGGAGALAMSRAEALGVNAIELLSSFALVLVPLAVIGYRATARDRRAIAWPYVAYGALLFLFMTLVTPGPARYGSLYRSAAALVPLVAALAPAGAAACAAWYARVRRHDVEAARRVLPWAIAVVMVPLAGAYVARELGVMPSPEVEPYNARLAYYRAIGAWIDAQRERREPVLTTNPPAFTFATGRASAMAPSDGALATTHAADAYGARYLLLESNLEWALPIWRSAGAIDGWRHVRDWTDGLGAPVRVYERVR